MPYSKKKVTRCQGVSKARVLGFLAGRAGKSPNPVKNAAPKIELVVFCLLQFGLLISLSQAASDTFGGANIREIHCFCVPSPRAGGTTRGKRLTPPDPTEWGSVDMCTYCLLFLMFPARKLEHRHGNFHTNLGRGNFHTIIVQNGRCG